MGKYKFTENEKFPVGTIFTKDDGKYIVFPVASSVQGQYDWGNEVALEIKVLLGNNVYFKVTFIPEFSKSESWKVIDCDGT